MVLEIQSAKVWLWIAWDKFCYFIDVKSFLRKYSGVRYRFGNLASIKKSCQARWLFE